MFAWADVLRKKLVRILFSRCCKLLGADEDTLTVYGADGVTSGASSDLQKATQVATAMVKVCYCPDPEIN